MRTKAAAAAMTVGLLGGGAAGLILGGTSTVGAEGESTTTTVEQPADENGGQSNENSGQSNENSGQSNENSGSEHRRGPGRRHAAKMMLEPAAEALGMSVADLAVELRDGRTIAEVAEEKGVDKQTVIDAMVADSTERITRFVNEGRGANKGD